MRLRPCLRRGVHNERESISLFVSFFFYIPGWAGFVWICVPFFLHVNMYIHFCSILSHDLCLSHLLEHGFVGLLLRLSAKNEQEIHSASLPLLFTL